MTCDECGARYADAGDSCDARFNHLLALDHSRAEPWGSRHGLAFAVFALQHRRRFDAATQSRALEMLRRVFERGEPLDFVVREMRARASRPGEHLRVTGAVPIGGFAVTIADLGEFAAAEYPAQLERWCRATLECLTSGARE